MRTLLYTFLAAFSFCNSAILAAQPQDRSGPAREAMEALRPMAGEWIQSVSMWRNGAWGDPAEERATINFLLADLAIRKLVPEDSETGVKMETTIQFDQYRGLYRMVAMDNSWGNMDIYESTSIEPGKIVFNNIRPGTFAKGPSGQVFYFRLTLSIASPQRHQLLVEISADEGASWQNFQRLDRTRIQ